MPNTKFQGSRVLVRSDIVKRKIKSHRVPSKQFLEFREKLNLMNKILQAHCKLHLKEKLCILNTVLKGLMVTCL